MQKCGQLQASIAVALIAQSAVGAEVWPADTPSRAMTTINPSLRIRFIPFGFEIMYQEVRSRKAILQPTREAEVEPLNGQRSTRRPRG